MLAPAAQTNLKNLWSKHNFLTLIQTRFEQLWTKWHAKALEFNAEWPFRIDGISSTRLLSWVLALSAVQVLDRAFLNDASCQDYKRAKRLFVWQLLLTLAHIIDELAPYLQYVSCNWTRSKAILNVLYSREGAKASWLLVNLLASIIFPNVLIKALKCKPLLLVATLALSNASIAYFVKSVVVDMTHFETLTPNYNFAILAHPLLIYAGHATYAFNAFLCAVYKCVPKKRELCSKLISTTAKLSIALLVWGASLGAYCNYKRKKWVWSWDHIECNTLMFIVINLLTIHLNKMGGTPRDSILGYQILTCPLNISFIYAIHHDLIPTNHGIEGPFGRGGMLAWALTSFSAVFVLTLLRSAWECIRAINARSSNPPYGLALACVLFVIVIIALMMFAVFAASRLGVVCAGVVTMSAWFGLSVLAFKLYNNKHSFRLAVLIAVVLIHILTNRQRALLKRAAIGYCGPLAIKYLYWALVGERVNLFADACHFFAMCALAFASVSQLVIARVRISLFYALTAIKRIRKHANVLAYNTQYTVAPLRDSYHRNSYVMSFPVKSASKLSGLCFNVVVLILLLSCFRKKWADY